MAYTFDPTLVADPVTFQRAANAAITVYDVNDTTNSTPLTLTDLNGLPLANPLTSTAEAFIPAFQTTSDQVKLVGGGLVVTVGSYKGIKDAAVAAQDFVQGIGVAATNTGAPGSSAAVTMDSSGKMTFTVPQGPMGQAGSNVLPTDTAIANAVNDSASATRGALASLFPIPALEAVQFTNYGDSYGDGAQGADQASRPFDRIAMRHRTQPLVHNAQAGKRMDEILSKIVATWTPNSRGLVGFSDGCINDEKQYADNTGAPTTVAAFRSCLAYLTSQAISGYSSSAFFYGPGWAAGSSSTVGSYVDVAFTGTTAHLLVSCVTGTGGTIEVRNAANTAIATISTGGFKQNFTGSVKITGGSGTNSYRLVLTAGTVAVVGIAVMSPTPPVIAWDKPGQISSNSSEATRLAYYLSQCAGVLSDFPTVVPVDMGSGWDYTTMISADITHRNDLGNKYATDKIEAALRSYLGSNFQQGLNALTAVTAAPAYTTPAASYTKTGATTPAAPTGFVATTSTQVSFSWSVPIDGGSTLTGYVIQSSPAGANTWTNVATIAASATSYVAATGFTASSSYDFRIAATNSVGTGAYSATSTATAGAAITTYASDTFTRSTLGTTETGGFAWTQNNGSTSWSCNGSQLVAAASATPAENECYIDDGQTNGTISVTRVASTYNSGIVFRATGANDVNGYIFWISSGGVWTLSKRTASNTYTSLGTNNTISPLAGQVMSVVLNGSSITCKVNGTTVITATDATYSGTRHGMWVNANNGQTWDGFSHTSATS